MDMTFTLQEAAAFLKIHPGTLLQKAKTGDVPGAKIGKRWVFLEIDLVAYVRSQYPRRALQGEHERSITCHSSNARIHQIGGSNSPLTTRNGRRVQQSSGTDDKVKAQEMHDKLKASLWDQERLGIKPVRTWREAVVRWLEETSEKATHQEDRRKLLWLHSFLGELSLDEINLDVIDGIRSAKLKEASKGTTNRYLALVRSILLRARDEWEWIDKAPKVRLFKETNGRERSLTPEQAKCLLRELPEHQREMVLFALATGLRQGNVVKLEWPQVNLDLCHAWVLGTQSKNRRPISVPLNDIAMGVLQRQTGKHPQRVFTYRGKPIAWANTKK
jgi:hypothetical protein